MKFLSWICFALMLASCTSGGKGPDKGVSFALPDLSGIYPYVENSAYSTQLKSCANISTGAASCQLSKLPLIGMEFDQPTVEQIMQRVLVSHDWMGLRFQEYLNEAPPEILTLFKATSAIVIASNIRPSFFLSYSGAIYLDSYFFWLNNEEKATVTKSSDYRSSFGQYLPFKLRTRNLINNEFAYTYPSLNGNEERPLEDIIISTSRVILHELAHANDCVPTQNMVNISDDQSYYSLLNSQKNDNQCAYQKLTDFSPLNSDIWKSLGRVLFHGFEETADQISMTPRSAGETFGADDALDFYSYSTEREDTAISFEVLMLKKLFNVDLDVYVVPSYTVDSCDIQVSWGERGRLAKPSVYARAEFVSDMMLPGMDLDTLYQSLPATFDIPEGSSSCTRDFSQTASAAMKVMKSEPFYPYEEIPIL